MTIAARLLASALVLGTATAHANTLSLTPADAAYQQTSNGPCVIGEPSCHQGSFVAPQLVPNGNSPFDVTSPLYSVEYLRSYVGNQFIVGFDVNQAGNKDQLLTFFGMYVNGTLVDSFSNPAGQAVPPTPLGNAGNGYADYVFANFTSLATFLSTDMVYFRAAMSLENAGGEQFFVLDIPDDPLDVEITSTSVPEPPVLALAGVLMIGSAFYLRRRQA